EPFLLEEGILGGGDHVHHRIADCEHVQPGPSHRGVMAGIGGNEKPLFARPQTGYAHVMSTETGTAPRIPRALFTYALLYGGLVCTAGVLGTKLGSLGTWPVLGSLAVESGIFAFLILVVLSSAVAELYGRDMANRLVRFGFVPLIVSMLLIQFVINVVPPAVFWHQQTEF